MKRNEHRIDNLTAMVKNRDKLIDNQARTIREIKAENKDLRYDNENLHEAVKQILNLTEINKYNNEGAILGKIKELAETAINY